MGLGRQGPRQRARPSAKKPGQELADVALVEMGRRLEPQPPRAAPLSPQEYPGLPVSRAHIDENSLDPVLVFQKIPIKLREKKESALLPASRALTGTVTSPAIGRFRPNY